MATRTIPSIRSLTTRHVVHTLAALGAITACVVSISGALTTPVPAVSAAPAPVIPFRDYVTGAALIESAQRDVLVASPVNGIIAAVFVRVGDRVKAGDRLYTIDAREATAEVALRDAAVQVARAELLEAEEAAAKAADDQQRVTTIDDVRAVSTEELATRRSTLRTAQVRLTTATAKVRAREAEWRAAQVAQAQHTVVAPIDGEVLGVSARPGELTGGTGTAPIRLGNVERLHVRVDIDENDAWRIRAGSRARLIVRGNSALTADLRFEYLERYVKPKTSLTGSGTERVDTRVLQVVYSLPSATLPLYVGQQVDVLVEVPSSTEGAR